MTNNREVCLIVGEKQYREFERLRDYVRSKNINISDKAISKMVKFK